MRHEELCVGCGTLRHGLPDAAPAATGTTFDPTQLFAAPPESRRGALGAALRAIARHAPSGPIEVPERVTAFRTIVYDAEKCLGCGACARSLPDRGRRGDAAESAEEIRTADRYPPEGLALDAAEATA